VTGQPAAAAAGVGSVVAVLYARDQPESYAPTVASLRRACPEATILAASASGNLGPLPSMGARPAPAGSLPALVNLAWSATRSHVLAVADPAVFPAGALGPALATLERWMHVATVSFLGNLAAFLSFPHRNQGVSHQIESLDEESITRLLRSTGPDLDPAPVPFAIGSAVLLSSYALSAVGPLAEDGPARALVSLVDFSLRARAKGFVDVVDPSTFCARPFDLAPVEDPWPSPPERGWLAARHPAFATLVDEESRSTTSALATVHRAARAKVLGLRVLVDGTCLGPKEMGTQVQTISLIRALARRPDVASVAVALATEVPRYAEAVLADPKVRARSVTGDDVSALGPVDVGHRPFQPERPLHVSWSAAAARTVVTLQDLIAYHGAGYHPSPAAWSASRDGLRRAVAEADGVVVISHDVAARVAQERLPVEAERTFVVQNGTDHLHGAEAAAVPVELLARGSAAGRFALVLGTNYSHKNRDLAVAAVAELRRRGLGLGLVMAGAAVPFGSSRAAESVAAAADRDGDGVWSIPDVTSEERNWLLRHASVVLYPTSAEGFGLIPYEAARFGTPTVLVPFGPLAEVVGALPVAAADWSSGALADAAEALVADPALAEAQVAAALSAGADFTWDATAAKLVAVYRSLLAQPARGGREVPWH
jgi:glycosyltransferase involved in cell wall biosynthesis